MVPQPSQLLICDATSLVRKRAKFVEHHIWVTRYRDGDLWAGGKWTNPSLVEADGVADYEARNEGVRDADVMLWHTYGITHNPRVEDYPVMPVEIMSIALKPADLFKWNPALDVPPSLQDVNKIVLVERPSMVRGTKRERSVSIVDEKSQLWRLEWDPDLIVAWHINSYHSSVTIFWNWNFSHITWACKHWSWQLYGALLSLNIRPPQSRSGWLPSTHFETPPPDPRSAAMTIE